MPARPDELTRRALLGAALGTAAALPVLGRAAARGRARSSSRLPRSTPPTKATDTFTAMLSQAPDVLAQQDPPLWLAQFGDVAAQLAALGAAQPESGDDPAFEGWISATQPILLPQRVSNLGLTPEFRELFGFDVLQVDQGLELGQPPETTTLLRGRFDERELTAAWSGAGYEEVDVDGATVYSLADGFEIDLDNPVNQLVLASFNNATILPDGTLALAPTLDLIGAVFAVGEGEATSLADDDAVAALLETLEQPLASALILEGRSLMLDPSFMVTMSPEAVERLLADIEATGTMPPALLAILGITPGGPIPPPPDDPDAAPRGAERPAVWHIRLLMPDDEAAALAAKTIARRIEMLDSLRRERPYSDLLTVIRSETLADPPRVAVELGFVEGAGHPALWHQMISARDLLFLAY